MLAIHTMHSIHSKYYSTCNSSTGVTILLGKRVVVEVWVCEAIERGDLALYVPCGTEGLG
jgi:hypothetical protein